MEKQNRKRKVQLNFRVTENEINYIKEKAAYSELSVSEYCRKAIAECVIVKREMSDVIKVLQELNRIGNNINQIAKAIHMQGDVVTIEDYNEVRKQVEEMRYLIIEKIYDSAFEYEKRVNERNKEFFDEFAGEEIIDDENNIDVSNDVLVADTEDTEETDNNVIEIDDLDSYF